MINETMMTIVGNVCDEPVKRITKSGHAVANLRVASTPRYFDRGREAWADRTTLFVDVTCWRALAEHVHASVHKGDPIVVTGRYTSHTYEVNEQLRYAQTLEAVAIGHDLARGTSVFRKAGRNVITHVPADENGVPVDETDRWIDAVRAPGSAPDSAPDSAPGSAPGGAAPAGAEPPGPGPGLGTDADQELAAVS